MFVNYDLYRIFISVATNNSFSKAAKELYTTQSTVSLSIAKLEDQLNKQLFDRKGKRIFLNDDGKNLLEYLLKGDKFFKNASSYLDNLGLKKQIGIACPNTMSTCVLMPYLSEYYKKNKEITFNILSVSGSKNRINSLEQNESIFCLAEKTDTIVGKDIEVVEFKKLHYTFMYNPDYYNFDNDVSVKEILENHILVQSAGTRARSYFESCVGENFLMNYSEFFHSDPLIEAISLGMGVGFAPIEYVRNRNIKIIEKFTKEITINLLFKKQNKQLAKDIFKI